MSTTQVLRDRCSRPSGLSSFDGAPRSARSRARWRVALASLAITGIALTLASCFDPRYPEGIPCSEAQTCPPTLICDVDGVCRRTPQQPPGDRPDADVGLPGDAGLRADARLDPDAATRCQSSDDCTDGKVCQEDGSCVAPTCTNGTQDGTETGIDCGGVCSPCGDGQTCRENGDCSSGVCEGTTCAAPRCGDSVRNGEESCDDGAIDTSTCDRDCTTRVCGDGLANAAANEACDQGGNTATCDVDCTLPECGDGLANEAADEACDQGGNTASCDVDCTFPACGDGLVNAAADEECDQGGNTATCDVDCTLARCGDGFRNPAAGEQCDTGGPSGTCSADCRQIGCGDGDVDPGEERDPPPGPSSSVPVDDLTCRYDFSAISQLYCTGTCGNWGGGNDCQQADADALCKLKMDNPSSTASSFTVGPTQAAPGICCPPPVLTPGDGGCVALGVLSDRGVSLPISVHDTNLQGSHGGGTVVTAVTCTDP